MVGASGSFVLQNPAAPNADNTGATPEMYLAKKERAEQLRSNELSELRIDSMEDRNEALEKKDPSR